MAKLGKKLKKIVRNPINAIPGGALLSSLLKGQELPGVPDSGPLQQALRESAARRKQLLEKQTTEQRGISGQLSSDLQRLIGTGGEEQRRLISGLRPQLSPLADALRRDVAAEGARGRTETATLARRFENVPTELADRQSAQLRQQVLESQPAAQQQLREALAASGGLRTGRASRGAQNLAVEAQKAIASGEEGIRQSGLAAQLRAREQAFSAENQALLNELGLNADVLKAINESGRGDLINETNALLGEVQNRSTALQAERGARGARDLGFSDQLYGGESDLEAELTEGLTGLQQQQQQQQFARDIAKTQNKQNRQNMFLNTGLNLGTAFLTGGASLPLQAAAGAAPAFFPQQQPSSGSPLSTALNTTARRRRRQPGSTMLPENLSINPGTSYGY